MIEGRTAQQIARSVEQAVTTGGLTAGALLPPVRSLAAELGVSPGTVSSAYQELRRRGLVLTKGRGGTVVADAVPAVSRRPTAPPPGVRDLSTGQPAPAFLPDIDGIALPGYGTSAHRGSPRLPALEELSRHWLGRDGVPSGQLTFAHGALDAIARLLQTGLRPGDTVALEDPGYHHLLDLVPALGLHTVPVAVDDEGIVPAALARTLREGAHAVVYSPRGQNPYGGAMSAARAAELGALLRAHPGVLVIEDDHAAGIGGAPLHSPAAGLERWAHVRTVSKLLGPDLRWAVVAGDAVTVGRHDNRLVLTSGWVSHLLQQTVLALLTAWLDDDPAGDAYAERREALLRELARHGVRAHGASGLNVWLPVHDEAAVVTGLQARGWWVAAGARFRLHSAPGVRVTITTLEPDEAARLAADFAAVLSGRETVGYGG